ncbi:MAG: DUF547 domain-containing protein [Acidobacteria bacterium]|nr:DUF547 domain-containing protein [Acidobacteriota bacterium]MCB9399359.1 DUF547 domain-containing protein [Acidobacteriota bacterium]
MLLCFWIWAQLNPFTAQPEIFDDLQKVYDVIVLEDGRVDYKTLKSRPDLIQTLDRVSDYASQVDILQLKDRSVQIAFFSNLYNVWVLRGVIKAWPIGSVREIKILFGFFTQENWNLGNQKISLNDLEKLWIRPLDARTHFLINCASVSCPHLSSQVFRPENVEDQMERLALAYLSDPAQNRFDPASGVWHLSKIFDWYEADFGGRQGIIEFIQKRVPDQASFNPRKILHIDYNWNLNGPTQ